MRLIGLYFSVIHMPAKLVDSLKWKRLNRGGRYLILMVKLLVVKVLLDC